MADENVQVKISGDGSGAIRALAAVATEQAKLTGQQIAHQKTLGAGDAEITALQKQQNLQLERAWKLRQQAAQVSFEASGDSSTKARENLQIEQERLAVKTAQVASERAVCSVVLGGGCFFNRVLTERCVAGLQARGLRVYQAQALSCGDAGLALGQAWVAAQQLAQAPFHNCSEETAACA
ncbi:MAG: hypothetical protein HUU13_15525 [Burkholderiaceae bacterium]|nr:hypothetical protein [Burkholderiaceae bacterium]